MRVLMAIPVMLLAACGQGGKDVSYVDSEGKERSLSVEDKGGTRVVKSDDGVLSAEGTMGGEKASFPDYAPQYAGSEVLSTVNMDMGGTKRQIITSKSDAPPATVIAFYKAEIAKSGKKVTELKTGQGAMLTVGKMTDPDLQITVDPDGAGSRFNHSVATR